MSNNDAFQKLQTENYHICTHTNVIQSYFNLLKRKRNLLYIRNRPYRAVNTFHHGYKNQSVNAV
jgi:hypothetical protein